jgi:tetratricopeptide (TPR) repeat protein
MNTLTRACTFLCALILGASLPAQVATDASSPAAAEAGKALADALKLRGDTVTAIVSGETTTDEAITRLKTENSPSGLKLDPGADFALAAIDVGQRLVTLKKPAEAEKFFQEAEQSLEQAVNKTPDSAARDKAMLLRKLAYIRSQYLNKIAQAKLDIEQAIKLQPEDKGLRRAKETLPNDSAELLKNKIKG